MTLDFQSLAIGVAVGVIFTLLILEIVKEEK